MVRDLLGEEGMEWDIELVRGLFLPQDAETILSIPISESIAKDRMVWVEDKKGIFTVRSVYRLAREIEVDGGNTGCSDSTKMHGVWQGVWSMNLPNKIKHFAWKACNGILPTKDSLFCRKITDTNICEVCGRQVETTMHMLCFCSCGTEVWSASKLSLPCNVQESWIFVDTFSRLRTSWEAQLGLLERSRTENQNRVAWKPPPPGSFKVNVDGALFSKSKQSGVGVMVHDEEGNVIAAMSRKMDLPLGVLKMEAKALEIGVKLAEEVGLRDVVFEGDSQLIINAIHGIGEAEASVQNIIQGKGMPLPTY
ncbi:uncharacterized protein LOC115964643 [Quercus lobata]|uniref:uncharacterized protein LOC115964643 n=1 Tax=Quercus lobata TaxID=97700 RepID=UPI001245C53C|nr:uncharacterized protein LOC115964643 [Quercus lobata]